MLIKYFGPSKFVMVSVAGKSAEKHMQGRSKNYPELIGQQLIRSKKQRFEIVSKQKDKLFTKVVKKKKKEV